VTPAVVPRGNGSNNRSLWHCLPLVFHNKYSREPEVRVEPGACILQQPRHVTTPSLLHARPPARQTLINLCFKFTIAGCPFILLRSIAGTDRPDLLTGRGQGVAGSAWTIARPNCL
jgi:hypothetical protein